VASEPGPRRFPVVALVLPALAILVPGILGLFTPSSVAGGAGATPADVLNDARAVGGTRFAIAGLLVFSAFSARWRRAGLAAAVVVFGCTLLGRLLSNALDGAPAAMLKPEVAEVVLIGLALVGLRLERGARS
jgi:hypothetical protein